MEDKVREWIDHYSGNKFAATNAFIKVVRAISKHYNYVVLDSEVISWLLKGERPKIIDEYDRLQEKIAEARQADLMDALNYIDDVEVVAAARNSVNSSIDARHLIYLYSNGMTERQQMRVRILTRMIWDKYHQTVK